MWKKFVSLTVVATEMGKRHYFSYLGSSCKENEIFNEKHESYTFELPLIKLSWLDKYKARKNVTTSKRYIWRKIAQKLKNMHFMTIFHDAAFKIETI